MRRVELKRNRTKEDAAWMAKAMGLNEIAQWQQLREVGKNRIEEDAAGLAKVMAATEIAQIKGETAREIARIKGEAALNDARLARLEDEIKALKLQLGR